MPLVRNALLEDAEDIARIHVRAWQAAYRGLVPDTFLDRMSVPKRAAQWRERLTASPRATRIVLDHDQLAGFASFGPSTDPDPPPGTTELKTLYLDPVAWGRGLGSLLWTHIARELAATPVATVTLWVFAANPRARHFYAQQGFAPDGATQTHSFDGTELLEVRYTKTFSPSHPGVPPSTTP